MQLHYPSCKASPFGNIPVVKFFVSFSLMLFFSACAERQDPLEGTWKLPGEEVSLEFKKDGTVFRIASSVTTTGTYRRDNSGDLFVDLGTGEHKALLSESNSELKVSSNGSDWLIFLTKPAAALVDSAQTIFTRGFETKDCDSSIALYSQVISLLTEIPSEAGHLARAYNNRGICEEKNGNSDAALADYNKAIELDPELDIAYGNRAWLHEVLGMKEKAFADYKKAAELGYRPAIYWMEQQKQVVDDGQKSAGRL